MKLGILISTYQRSDGKTPFYLTRALQSIKNQSYTNYVVILMGDDYENNHEFIQLSQLIEPSKIIAENLPKSIERSSYKRSLKLWSAGATNAYNKGIESGLAEGIDYFCQLDHDDYWAPNHLEVIASCIKETQTNFVVTVSSFLNNENFPNIVDGETHLYMPKAEKIINSAVCVNYRKVNFRYRDVYHETGIVYPSDADLWNRIISYFLQTNQTGRLIGIKTCYHEEEGFEIGANPTDWLDSEDIEPYLSNNDTECLRYLLKGYHAETTYLKEKLKLYIQTHKDFEKSIEDLQHEIKWMENTIYWKIRSFFLKITGRH
jgi:glycosyltransferase involved in cell wall biosynthesis